MDLIINESLRSRCLSIARRLVGPNDAEDVCQETCLRALLAGKEGQFQGVGREAWEGYVFRILRRCAINAIRERRNAQPSVESLAREPDDHSNFLYQIVLSTTVASALARLPEDQATVVIMVDAEEIPINEVAQSLSLPRSTVNSRLRAGRARLRQFLAEESASAATS